jgi:hypothetical protein
MLITAKSILATKQRSGRNRSIKGFVFDRTALKRTVGAKRLEEAAEVNRAEGSANAVKVGTNTI